VAAKHFFAKSKKLALKNKKRMSSAPTLDQYLQIDTNFDLP
jgi:hypothetical protein